MRDRAFERSAADEPFDNIPLTDACLPAIESLEELRSLTIEKTEITPAAFEVLQKKLQGRNVNR